MYKYKDPPLFFLRHSAGAKYWAQPISIGESSVYIILLWALARPTERITNKFLRAQVGSEVESKEGVRSFGLGFVP